MHEFTLAGSKWRELADWWQDHMKADQEKLNAEAVKETKAREAQELAAADTKRRAEAQRIENIRARAERTKARNDQLRAARQTPKTAKSAFRQFLDVAGFKYVNIGSSLGGVDDDTPEHLTVLMLVGDGEEYNLGNRTEPFVFNPDGSFRG